MSEQEITQKTYHRLDAWVAANPGEHTDEEISSKYEELEAEVRAEAGGIEND